MDEEEPDLSDIFDSEDTEDGKPMSSDSETTKKTEDIEKEDNSEPFKGTPHGLRL